MILKYFYDDNLAQASYLVGCPDAGTAMIVDPARDVRPYLQMAEREGLTITAVAETHIHADYVSGGRELAHQTDATLYVSAMGEGDLAYNLPDDIDVKYVREGDEIMVGGVGIKVLFSLGHTPEHVMFEVTDVGATLPVGIFTGDFLFAGDVGRPDLLEEAVKVADTKEEGARQQFANVQRLKTMPDYLQIWPGHGAGSACGKALGAVPSTTLGYEKLTNPAFQFDDESDFVTWLLDGQPEPPRYFAQMKAVNAVGAALLDTLPSPSQGSVDQLQSLLNDLDNLIIDVRSQPDYAEKHIRGTINIPAESRNFCTYVGWYVNYGRPTYLIADDAQIDDLLRRLRAIGVDDMPTYFTTDVIDMLESTRIKQVSVQEARRLQKNGTLIVDVRGLGEREDQHIPESKFIPLGEIPDRMHEIPRDQPVIYQCGGGTRSQIVASIMEKHGFDVLNLSGGINAWEEAGLPLNR